MEEKKLKKAVVFSAIWKFMERIIAQLVSLVVAIILARLLSPDDYSSVSLVTVFFSFANIIIAGGFNSALIQKKDSDELDYSTILIFSFAVSILIYIVLFISAPLIAKIYHRDDLTLIIRIMGLVLPITAIKSVWCAYISSRLLFKKFFMATIVGTIMSAFVGIIMAYRGFGAWALVAQNMTNTLIDTVILIATTHVFFGFKFSIERFKGLFKYGWKVLVSSIIGTIYSQTVPLFIGVKYSNKDLSYYTKGKSFPELISSTTTYTLSAVLFPFLSKFQDNKQKLLEFTRLYIRLSSYVAFPLMLGFFAVSDSFVMVVLTDKWLPAVHYIRVFCVTSMFDMVHVGNCETIKAMGRSDIFLKMEIIKKTGYFVTIATFLYFTKKPETLAYAFIVCTIIALLVNSVPNRALIGYKFELQLMDLVPNLLIAVVMAFAVSYIGVVLPKGSIITLLVQIISGVVVYIVLSVLSRNSNLGYLLSIIRKLLLEKRFEGLKK